MIPDMYLILFMLIFNSVPGMVNGALDQLITVDKLERRPACSSTHLRINSSSHVFSRSHFSIVVSFFKLKTQKLKKNFFLFFLVWQSLVQFTCLTSLFNTLARRTKASDTEVVPQSVCTCLVLSLPKSV